MEVLGWDFKRDVSTDYILRPGLAMPVFGASKWHLKVMRDAFFGATKIGGMPANVLNSVSSIAILIDGECSDFCYEDEQAHCNHDGRICILRRDAKELKRIVWHEAGHAWYYELQRRYLRGNRDGARSRLLDNDWFTEWNDAAKGLFKLLDDYKNEWSGDFPKSGILRSFGLKNIREDIATWVEEVNAACNGCENLFGRVQKDDIRYQKKLKILLDKGFITGNQYNFIKPLCTP